jgi:hypothetical protein
MSMFFFNHFQHSIPDFRWFCRHRTLNVCLLLQLELSLLSLLLLLLFTRRFVKSITYLNYQLPRFTMLFFLVQRNREIFTCLH